MTCPSCGQLQSTEAAICAACGAALPAPCSRCGRATAAGDNFCRQCGAPLRGDVVSPAPPAPNARPRAYTPNHLIDKILRSRSAVEGERKQVTVFFVDVKESMHLAERVDPEEWHRMMDRFFAILADGIHRFEGTINQFTGDGVMALFGAPLAHEDHAQRACYAALQVREQVRLWARELKRGRGLTFAVRMGLNSGEVIVGTIGDDLRMDYTAQGHTVGLAARMQQIAEGDGIYLTAHTAALVSSFFELQAVGRVRLKGVRAPVRTFALIDAARIRTRLEAARARGFSPFVGRGDEVALLEAGLSRAIAGHGQVIGVAGAAGVGKSRLCREAIERWRAEGTAVVEAHCPAHGKALPFATLRDLLRSFFAIAADTSAAVSRRQIRTRLRRLHRGLVAEAPLLLDFLGFPDPKSPAPPLAETERRARLFAFVRRLVQTHSAAAPTVLLIDDAHWIDAESDAFVAELVESVNWTRTLLLLNFRPDYAADWMRASHYRRLELAPLATDVADALLCQLVGESDDLGPVRGMITARAEGNPFFIEEIVQSLIDQGVLVRERPAPRGAATPGVRVNQLQPLDELRIPATVQSLLAARIDALPDSAKHALQVAAVIGKHFTEPVLRHALAAEAMHEAGLDRALEALAQADLIRAEDAAPHAAYAFKHPLTQEVAYGAQLQEPRAARHEAVARAFEALHADRLGEYASLLAHHWAAANKRYEAQLWRRRAALRVTTIQIGRGSVRVREQRTP